ncbi:NAD(P)-binding protein [Durotheca rogersii]|uniref:NAD(P)-binding protein n=1 Tax=Durotheca rogersii TaxID=419775 RepID=UPI00221F8CA1|nr:NAD(P)-binding protein [Durotheca rogersii]KAI5864136.1 NAD(P)-binding protein [Durotheca rogersii]
MTSNKTLIFKKPPTGFPVAGEHIAVEDRPLDLDAPAPAGGLVLELLYASFDPYLRGRMRDARADKSYSSPFAPGDPIVNSAVARVRQSGAAGFAAGDLVTAFVPIAEYAVVGDAAAARVRRVENPHGLDLGLFLGPLGMPGLTAYASLREFGALRRGETLFVSSAAGAVGQVVGALAKREGLRVVGSVGSDAKRDYVTRELGFDAAFNYRTESPAAALPRLAPDGVDVYFENVGGEHLEAAIDNMNERGRILVCGMISVYNQPPAERYGIKNLHLLIGKLITMRGFLVGQAELGPAYAERHQRDVQAWLADGSFPARLHVTDGIDRAADGLIGIFHGDNFGKAVVKIR